MSDRVALACSGGPPKPMAILLNVHFSGCTPRAIQLTLDTGIRAFLGHPSGNGPALLLDHREVFNILVGVKEELACVELNHNACHRPNIRCFLPD